MVDADRLDYDNPPPGWDWYDHRKEHVADIGTGKPGLLTVSEAWMVHKRQHDPPGALVTGRDDLRKAAWFAEGRPDHAAGFTSIAEARADAWAWYERDNVRGVPRG